MSVLVVLVGLCLYSSNNSSLVVAVAAEVAIVVIVIMETILTIHYVTILT